jgi:hypothetical protein
LDRAHAVGLCTFAVDRGKQGDKFVLTTSTKIEVNRPPGAPIGTIMNEIRSWLDQNKIEPIDFKTVVGRQGIGFEIRFRTEGEAERFQREFA